MKARAAGLLLVACAGVLAAEVGLRLGRYGPTAQAFGRWSTAPPWDRLRALDARGDPTPLSGASAAWALAPGEPVIRYRLNSLGLREERELDRRPPAGTCRILALGDAYTFGYGVASERTYPARLERLLARRARVEVLNAGFPNLDVEQQRRRLGELLGRLHPRLVVLNFDWWNVPLEESYARRPAKWSGAWVAANVEQKAARAAGTLAVADAGLTLARDALTPRVFAPSGLARELEPLALPPAALAPRWARAQNALAGMAADAAAAGARFALVVTPLDLQVDPARQVLYRDRRLPYPAHGFVDLDYTQRQEMPEALRRFAAKAGIPLLDTTPAFRARAGDGLFLASDYHAAPRGHRLIAREVARFVERTGACGIALEG